MKMPGPKVQAVKREISVQDDMFGIEKKDSTYTSKIAAPIYKPKNKKPSILELVNTSKARKLCERIALSGVSEHEKFFLISAAWRHNVFRYDMIADYYANSNSEMQRLMEESALVILDLGDAIKNGYVKFNKEIKELYARETKD